MRTGSASFPVIAAVVVVACTVGLLGYRYSFSVNSRRAGGLAAKRQEENSTRFAMTRCADRLHELQRDSRLRGGMTLAERRVLNTLSNDVAALRAANEVVFARHRWGERRHDECEAALERERALEEAATKRDVDLLRARLLDAEARRAAMIVVAADDVSTRDAGSPAIAALLQTLRSRSYKLRAMLQTSTESDEEYESRIVEKWLARAPDATMNSGSRHLDGDGAAPEATRG